QIIADWLADNPLDGGDLIDLDFPDECVYYIETRPAISECPWYTDIINYIIDHMYPEAVTPQQRRQLHIIIAKYVIIEQVLYQKAFDGMLLSCVDTEESKRILHESHS
ncbi:hypothetical protein KI387_030075, partial [Taxus chinensis]